MTAILVASEKQFHNTWKMTKSRIKLQITVHCNLWGDIIYGRSGWKVLSTNVVLNKFCFHYSFLSHFHFTRQTQKWRHIYKANFWQKFFQNLRYSCLFCISQKSVTVGERQEMPLFNLPSSILLLTILLLQLSNRYVQHPNRIVLLVVGDRRTLRTVHQHEQRLQRRRRRELRAWFQQFAAIRQLRRRGGDRPKRVLRELSEKLVFFTVKE